MAVAPTSGRMRPPLRTRNRNLRRELPLEAAAPNALSAPRIGDCREDDAQPRASGRGAAHHSNVGRRLRRRRQQHRRRRRQQLLNLQRRSCREVSAWHANGVNGDVARSPEKRERRAGGGATPAPQTTPAPRVSEGAAVSWARVYVRTRLCTRGRALIPHAHSSLPRRLMGITSPGRSVARARESAR